MDIRSIVDLDRFSQIITVSDVHNEFHILKKVVDYALQTNSFIILLGDLVDGGPHPEQTHTLVKHLLDNKLACFARGNHDDKLYRYSVGNPVKLSADQWQTLSDCADPDAFILLLKDIFTHPMSSYYFYFDNFFFVHGGTHRDLFNYPDTVVGDVKHTAIFGETDGTQNADGYPTRIYDWCENIPSGKIAVVAHDRRAFGKDADEFYTYDNPQGGRVVFTDTGCGKSPGAPVGTAIIQFDGSYELRKFR